MKLDSLVGASGAKDAAPFSCRLNEPPVLMNASNKWCGWPLSLVEGLMTEWHRRPSRLGRATDVGLATSVLPKSPRPSRDPQLAQLVPARGPSSRRRLLPAKPRQPLRDRTRDPDRGGSHAPTSSRSHCTTTAGTAASESTNLDRRRVAKDDLRPGIRNPPSACPDCLHPSHTRGTCMKIGPPANTHTEHTGSGDSCSPFDSLSLAARLL